MTLHTDIFILGGHLLHVLTWIAVGWHRHLLLCSTADFKVCLEPLNILVTLQHYELQYYMSGTFHENTGEWCHINNWIDYLFESDFIPSVFSLYLWWQPQKSFSTLWAVKKTMNSKSQRGKAWWGAKVRMESAPN